MEHASSFSRQAPVHRLQAPLPKIGIRPVIDGRYGGVRESLEQPVLAMARAAADLLSRELRHPCGLPVECVVFPKCIGGLAEAAECDALFAREAVGATLTVTPCWCYGSETMDTDPLRPKAVWGFNGTERPGAVYLAAVLAAHAQKGLPAFGIYGKDVQDAGDTAIPPDVAERLLRFGRAAVAVATMRGTNYLSAGGVSMGIAGSLVDHGFFQRYLGMRVMTVDMVEFVRRIERGIFDPEEFERAMAWVRQWCREGRDPNPEGKRRDQSQKQADWEYSVKCALVMRDLMVGNPKLEELGYPEEARGHNAIAGGFQGQRQWTDHLPNGDFLEAILNTSFDWNGIRQPYIVATENDALNGVGMLFGHLLTGSAQLFSDVRTYWSPEAVRRVTGLVPTGPAEGGFIHLINSGPSALDWTGEQTVDGKPAVKPWWLVEPSEAERCLEATLWCPANLGYFRGGGFSTDFQTKAPMPVTMSRLNLVSGLGPVLQIAEGWVVDIPEEIHRKLDERTDPTWPTTWFVPRITGNGPFRDVYTVMANWGANHGSICFGHVGADLITLASMLRIPVDMHNVDEQALFRPAVWSRFGALDPQGADYRACSVFGPLYG
ncbi:MAG: L-fucose isomerase [Fimbriimonadales bacterium]|nr:L-fucose isomerase [Fimbriimonadales bacterium]